MGGSSERSDCSPAPARKIPQGFRNISVVLKFFLLRATTTHKSEESCHRPQV